MTTIHFGFSLLTRLVIVISLLFAGSVPVLAEPLRVGIYTGYPPLAYRQNDQITGIEATLAMEVGQLLRRDIQFIDLPFEELIPALEAKRIDVIMSGLSVTPERSELVDYTDSHMDIGQMAIIRVQDAAFALPMALSRTGARIGVEAGTTGAEYAHLSLPVATITEYPSPDAGLKALQSEQIDFFIHDAPTSWNLAQRNDTPFLPLFRPLTKEQLAWAVRKGDKKLLNQLNRALGELQTSGKVAAIQRYFIPVTIEVGP